MALFSNRENKENEKGSMRKKRFRIKRPFYKKAGFWGFIGFLFSIIGILYFIFFSPIFLIKNIHLSSPIEREEEFREKIINFLRENILKRENIWVLNLPRAKDGIKKVFWEIEDLEIKKKLPNTIFIKIKKREPAFNIFHKENEWFVIDRRGVIFRKEGEKRFLEIKGNFPQDMEIGMVLIKEEHVDKILRVTESLSKMGLSFRSIFYGEDKIEIEENEGWRVIFSLENDIDTQLRKLEIFLRNLLAEKRKLLEYVDVRFGNYVFPKYKNITQ